MCAVTEAVSVFVFLEGWLTSRRYRLFAGGLFDRVIYILIRVRLVAAKVVLGLIPITSECSFDAIPG